MFVQRFYFFFLILKLQKMSGTFFTILNPYHFSSTYNPFNADRASLILFVSDPVIVLIVDLHRFDQIWMLRHFPCAIFFLCFREGYFIA